MPIQRLLAPLSAALAFLLGACSSDNGDLPRALREPFAATAFDSTRGVTVLFGGLDGSRASETWEWDGNTWTLRATSGPSPRQGHALAFDSGRGLTVLFGGFEGDGHLSDETWEWDGNTWTKRTQPSSPFPRYGHAMCYDTLRGVIYLYGGADTKPLDDTWEYTGSNGRWSQRGFASPPGPLVRHAMVFDAVRNVALLFGGQDTLSTEGPFTSDLWQWEGALRRWTKIDAVGPSARYLHAMVFDGTRTLLFGGFQKDYSYVGDTWAWDGVAWAQIPTPTEPSPRASHAMAFDSVRNVAVLYGGYDGSYNRETWEWDGTQWVERDAAFSSPRVPDLSTRGFVLIEDRGSGIRSLGFQLDADALGLRGRWMGTR